MENLQEIRIKLFYIRLSNAKEKFKSYKNNDDIYKLIYNEVVIEEDEIKLGETFIQTEIQNFICFDSYEENILKEYNLLR